MKRVLIEEVPKFLETIVEIQGFVQKIRNQKQMQFLIIRDRTGVIQATHEKTSNVELTTTISNLTPESVVKIVGKVIDMPNVKLGGVEIVIQEITILSMAETALPISSNTGYDGRANWRHIDLRSPKNYLIFQIQTLMEMALREYWCGKGFIEIHTPKLMGAPSESGAELFSVPYFDTTAYLAQSPQFYKQMAMAAGMERVFEIGPVFRANPSFTSRHDTEFTSIDMEMAFIDSVEDVMTFEEMLLIYVLTQIKEKYAEKIKEHFGVDVFIPSIPFPRITLKDARSILKEKLGHEVSPETDLDPEGERRLSSYIKAEYGHEFVFVTDYPIEFRPFYHMRHLNNPGLTCSFDLLWKGLEITTGAQREHRYEILRAQVAEKGLNEEPIKHYLEFFRYGCPPHGGFGLGMTRLLMQILGVKNVREVTFLHRSPNRLFP